MSAPAADESGGPLSSDMLAMVISEMMLHVFGFGPSQSICKPFAEQVIHEAESVKYRLRLP